MELVCGSVKFGGSVAYCQQNAWIQNLSLRENILFGHDWDEKRYWEAIQDAALPSDLVLLPDGGEWKLKSSSLTDTYPNSVRAGL